MTIQEEWIEKLEEFPRDKLTIKEVVGIMDNLVEYIKVYKDVKDRFMIPFVQLGRAQNDGSSILLLKKDVRKYIENFYYSESDGTPESKRIFTNNPELYL